MVSPDLLINCVTITIFMWQLRCPVSLFNDSCKTLEV